MALSSCPPQMEITDRDLKDWQVKGSGGFGQIYKARHLKWCCDVAVKVLHYDDGTSSSLLRELKMMLTGSNPYVIHVLGVFKGHLPFSGPPAKLGLVMEFMERGSLAFLQRTLQGSPPWPLAFRLAHQVALGINFLHNLSPPLLHLDLKPSNVLLDSSLNAKLTDFGLARFSRSITRVSKKDSEEEGGTISYMPPEAFAISYNPTRASDIYSYGILLWSIATGKEPYPNALSSIVRLRIPAGDRPSLDEIRCLAAGHAGPAQLIELMEKCWVTKPAQRPTAHECTTVTEELYKMHKHVINDVVHQVLKKLDGRGAEEITQQIQQVSVTQYSVPKRELEAVNFSDNVPTGRPPVQEVACGWAANQRDNATVTDFPSPRASSSPHADHARSTDYKMKASSVQPIQSSPSLTSTSSRLPEKRTPKNTHSPLKASLFPSYQRQFSSPDALLSYSPPRVVNIHLSNVTGFQNGNNNTMHIYTSDPLERKRHPTAPSTINLPSSHRGGSRDKN